MARKNTLGCWNRDLCEPRGNCLCELRAQAYDQIRDLHKTMEQYSFQGREQLLKQVQDHEAALRGWIEKNLGAYKIGLTEYKRSYRRKKVITRVKPVSTTLSYFQQLGAQAAYAPWVAEAVEAAFTMAKVSPAMKRDAQVQFRTGFFQAQRQVVR